MMIISNIIIWIIYWKLQPPSSKRVHKALSLKIHLHLEIWLIEKLIGAMHNVLRPSFQMGPDLLINVDDVHLMTASFSHTI